MKPLIHFISPRLIVKIWPTVDEGIYQIVVNARGRPHVDPEEQLLIHVLRMEADRLYAEGVFPEME